MNQNEPYEKLAIRTKAPIPPAQERIVDNLGSVFMLLAENSILGLRLDALKKLAFYGRVPGDGVLPQPVNGGTVPTDEIKARITPLIVDLLHAGLGFATEAAEFLDAIASHVFEGKPLDLTNLGEEIGDNQWYAGIAADAIQTTLAVIQRTNIAKLRARFPDKFTEEHAENRDLARERTILEGGTPTGDYPGGTPFGDHVGA